MIDILYFDSYRKHGRVRFRDVVFGLIFSRTHRVLISLRVCQFLYGKGFLVRRTILPFAKFFHVVFCQLAGVDLPWRTNIGPGLAITHGWGLVISEGAKIGSNVTLFHGVTLGRADRFSDCNERIIGYPTLEDNVWVGPNATIVGDVVVGRGSRIAAGAFVNKSVSPFSLVIGNPSFVAKSGICEDVFNKAQV
ncbi:MAG: serine acetyltransferase [Azonexaceae bacterium]|nr:serine acetyltransferase [Azonexaceae bacterium]